MHVDIRLRNEAHLDDLLQMGATVVSVNGHHWVLTDPEGNEFCA